MIWNRFKGLMWRARYTYYRRGYYLSRFWRFRVPPAPIADLPDGFSVQRIADTGLTLIENFCTAEEADYFIDKARGHLNAATTVDVSDDSLIVSDYRTSEDAPVYQMSDKDPRAYALIVRAAMLLGLPASHSEEFPVTRYTEGQYFKPHFDAFDGFYGDRLYTLVIYLNDVDDDGGGATVFPNLKLAVQPKLGRAVCWRNVTVKGEVNPASLHAGIALREGAEKWIIQLGFRPYPLFKGPREQATRMLDRPGIPLDGPEQLPEGAWVLDAVGDNESSATESKLDS